MNYKSQSVCKRIISYGYNWSLLRLPKSMSMGLTSDEEDEESTPVINDITSPMEEGTPTAPLNITNNAANNMTGGIYSGLDPESLSTIPLVGNWGFSSPKGEFVVVPVVVLSGEVSRQSSLIFSVCFSRPAAIRQGASGESVFREHWNCQKFVNWQQKKNLTNEAKKPPLSHPLLGQCYYSQTSETAK